jgi:hypothetical protein
MSQWIKDNQVLAGLLIMGVINLLIDAWKQWFASDDERKLEQRSGCWAGIAMIIRGGGVDVVKILTGVGQLVMSLLGAVKKNGGAALILFGLGALAASNATCATASKKDVKTVVDIARDIIGEVCSPDEPTLDACIDKLLSDPRVQAAHPQTRDAGTGAKP